MRTIIKKAIPAKGYPLTSKRYLSAHMLASKKELHVFGRKNYDRLDKIASKHPGELLGSHWGKKIEVSMIVPRKLRKEVKVHEQLETMYMHKSH